MAHNTPGRLVDKRGNAGVSTVTQILRRLGSDMTMAPNGVAISRSELLAQYLWELVITKQVQLASGEIIKATNGEWLEVVFKIVERLEGKPAQSISAEINAGLILNRPSRISDGAFTTSVSRAIADPRVIDSIIQEEE